MMRDYDNIQLVRLYLDEIIENKENFEAVEYWVDKLDHDIISPDVRDAILFALNKIKELDENRLYSILEPIVNSIIKQ